jgi:putative flippase GtrA
VRGTRHAALAGLVACAAGSAVGVAVSLAVPLHHKLVAIVVAVPAAGCAIIAFGVVAYFLDNGDLRAVLTQARRVVAKLRS